MKSYDVKCPICGVVNRNLNLEETHGWMECENCKQKVQPLPLPSELTVKIPVYTPKQLAQQQKAAP